MTQKFMTSTSINVVYAGRSMGYAYLSGRMMGFTVVAGRSEVEPP